MKKWFALALVLSGLTGCGDGEQQKIVGKWKQMSTIGDFDPGTIWEFTDQAVQGDRFRVMMSDPHNPGNKVSGTYKLRNGRLNLDVQGPDKKILFSLMNVPVEELSKTRLVWKTKELGALGRTVVGRYERMPF